MLNVFIVGGNRDYIGLFLDHGAKMVSCVEDADLVVFTGGEDVTPALYNAHKHPETFNSQYRDAKEGQIFLEACEAKIPMVGICRGGQFLNVCSGGEMYQDISGHLGDHQIVDLRSGETITVSSTHHQMMKPSDKAEILATSVNILSNREWFEGEIFKRDSSSTGIEVVFYEETNCLCFQPHPEFRSPHYQKMKEYFFSLIKEKLNVNFGAPRKYIY